MLWKPGAAALQTVLARCRRRPGRTSCGGAHASPKRHPSALHHWDYAQFAGAGRAAFARWCAERRAGIGAAGDAGCSGPRSVDGHRAGRAGRVFFVKAPADEPIRFALLDAKGAVLRQEHGWFWIRGGEQRYCVGATRDRNMRRKIECQRSCLRTTTPVDLTESLAAQRAAAGRQLRCIALVSSFC